MEQAKYLKYLRLVSVIDCMRKALCACQMLDGHPEQSVEAQIIMAGLVATYIKPFTGCNGVQKHDVAEFNLPPDLLAIHNHLLAGRHKMYAHTDFLNVFTDPLGNPYQNEVILTVAEGAFTSEMSASVFFPAFAPQIALVAHEIWLKAQQEVDSLLQAEGLPVGSYTARANQQFVPRV